MQIYKNNQNISSRLRINNKKLFLAFGVLITLIIIIASLIFIFNLLIDPAKVNLPKNERRGYLQDWTAGYGLKEVAHFLLPKVPLKLS